MPKIKPLFHDSPAKSVKDVKHYTEEHDRTNTKAKLRKLILGNLLNK